MKKISIIILLLAVSGIGCSSVPVAYEYNNQTTIIENEDVTEDESDVESEGPVNIEIEEIVDGKKIYELLEKYNSGNVKIETIKAGKENILKITYNEKIEYRGTATIRVK